MEDLASFDGDNFGSGQVFDCRDVQGCQKPSGNRDDTMKSASISNARHRNRAEHVLTDYYHRGPVLGMPFPLRSGRQ